VFLRSATKEGRQAWRNANPGGCIIVLSFQPGTTTHPTGF
jgi:hypothetical protein